MAGSVARQRSHDREIDVRGLTCPMPALRARVALGRMKAGQVLRIVASDPGSPRDIATFCHNTGHELLAQSTTRKEFVFLVRKA